MVKVERSESCSVVSDSLQTHGLHSPQNSLSPNTGVGSLSLIQGIFPTQGSNPGLPHYSRILYQLSHKGSTRILEWVVYPFSSGSSWPRNRTGVSCNAGRFFTNWAIRVVVYMSVHLHSSLIQEYKYLLSWLFEVGNTMGNLYLSLLIPISN